MALALGIASGKNIHQYYLHPPDGNPFGVGPSNAAFDIEPSTTPIDPNVIQTGSADASMQFIPGDAAVDGIDKDAPSDAPLQLPNIEDLVPTKTIFAQFIEDTGASGGRGQLLSTEHHLAPIKDDLNA